MFAFRFVIKEETKLWINEHSIQLYISYVKLHENRLCVFWFVYFLCVYVCFPFYQNDAALVYLNERYSNLECRLRAKSFSVILNKDAQV